MEALFRVHQSAAYGVILHLTRVNYSTNNRNLLFFTQLFCFEFCVARKIYKTSSSHAGLPH